MEAGQVGLGSLKAEGKGLYKDFVDVLLPRLVGLVKEIPVPRIEFKSEGERAAPPRPVFRTTFADTLIS